MKKRQKKDSGKKCDSKEEMRKLNKKIQDLRVGVDAESLYQINARHRLEYGDPW